MKTLAKTLLIASAIALPAISYAGSGHDHNASKSETHEMRQMDKECENNDDCNMTEEMKDMDDSQMQEHMKKMNNNKHHDDDKGDEESHSH